MLTVMACTGVSLAPQGNLYSILSLHSDGSQLFSEESPELPEEDMVICDTGGTVTPVSAPFEQYEAFLEQGVDAEPQSPFSAASAVLSQIDPESAFAHSTSTAPHAAGAISSPPAGHTTKERVEANLYVVGGVVQLQTVVLLLPARGESLQ